MKRHEDTKRRRNHEEDSSCLSSSLRAFVSLLLSAALILSGCSPDAYRRDADLQVNRLLRDRKQQTLGYQPETKIQSDRKLEDSPPPKAAYAKIPQTPLPPLTASPIEPIRIDLPYGELGPQRLFPLGMAAPRRETLGVVAAQQRVQERLLLGPPAAGANILSLDFFRTLEYALTHSRDYQSRMEDLYLAALDVTLQRHLFEPRPFATQSFTYTGGQKDLGYKSALSAVTSVGVRQQLPYGGELTAQALMTLVDALNNNTTSGESASVALTGSIPLLRGAGLVNLEPLIDSERQLVYQVRDFEEFRRSFVVQIASAYFRLIN